MSRAPHLLSLALAGLLLAGLMGTRLWLAGGEHLLGFGGAEVWGHAWVQWWHGAALPAWPSGTDLAQGTGDWPVIDPLPTLVGASAGRVLGPLAGYNLWVLLAVALAFFGGALAARWHGGDPWTGGLALALFPAFVGTISSGLTEDAAVGLAAMGMALVGHRSKRGALAAGLLLGLLAWCGLVLAFWTGLAAIALGLAAIAHDRDRWKGVILGGLLALAIASPLMAWHGARLLGEGHRAGEWMPQIEPLWRLNPWKGVDLLSFWVPGRQAPGDALVRMHPGYLGLSLLGLAVWGRRRRPGRGAWWGVLGATILLAPGLHLSFAGQPLGVPSPAAALLAQLPMASLVNHHGRVLLVAGIVLAVLAARGVAQLGPRGQWAARGLLLLDLALLGPVPVPLMVADARAPAAASDLATRPASMVLAIPMVGPGVHFQRPLLDQRVHQKALMLHPNRPGLPGDLARTETGRWLMGLAQHRPAPAPSPFVAPAGVDALLVLPPYVDRVAEELGPPTRIAADGSAVFDL